LTTTGSPSDSNSGREAWNSGACDQFVPRFFRERLTGNGLNASGQSRERDSLIPPISTAACAAGTAREVAGVTSEATLAGPAGSAGGGSAVPQSTRTRRSGLTPEL
jgi:hypothetical protein